MRRGSVQPRTVRPAVEALEARALFSTTYYVSPTGSNTNPGTAPDAPFQTLAAIDARVLNAGDQVLLAGGATFDGTITLTAADGGTAAAPITISSYGTGQATLNAGAGDGIDVTDTAGVDISNLAIVGTSAIALSTTGAGIQLTNDLPGDVKLAHVYIADVDVSGFGFTGIGIGGTIDGAGGGSGFADVRVTGSAIHGNLDDAIFSYAGAFDQNPAPYGLAHSGILVDDVQVYGNSGRTGQTDSGNGIKLGNVDGATVEHCVAHDNGSDNNSTIGGPCGIWTYNSNAVVIQDDQSYDNVSAHTDGGGYDLDGGVTNSLIQYNYSFGNDGAGILLAQFAAATAWSGNVIRYNVSQDDARRNNYGGIDLYTGAGAPALSDSQFYGNTVYLTPVAGTNPIGLFVDGETDGFGVYNNIFEVGSVMRPLVVSYPGTDLTLAGNDYWTGSATALNLVWDDTVYGTLGAFRAGTGEEMVGATPTGLGVEPDLVDAGNGGTPAPGVALTASLPQYQLQPGSPLIDAGVSLPALGVDPGATDFYGTAVPQGAGFDVGAAEFNTGLTPVAATVAVAISPAAVVTAGTTVTLTATVSTGVDSIAVPTGTVTFTLADGTVVGTAALGAGATAAVISTALPTGVDAITASYSGDGDHLAAATLATVTANAPGLASSFQRSTLPATAVAGVAHVGGRVTLSVTNVAAATVSGRATIELFASPTGNLDGSAVRVAAAAVRVSLRSSRVASVTVAVAGLPTTLAAGTYRLVARITTADGVASISPAGPSIAVQPAAVALAVTVQSSRLPVTATVGAKVARPVVLAVTNTGNTATTAPLTATLYLSTDGTLATAVAVGAVKSKSAIKPNRPAVKLSVTLSKLPASIAGRRVHRARRRHRCRRPHGDGGAADGADDRLIGWTGRTLPFSDGPPGRP